MGKSLRPSNDSTPKFVSLFCGCGGLDLGFLRAGFKCIRAYDIEPIAIQLHRINLKTPAELRDLSKDPPQESELTDVDVIIAGPPCQGFSTAGKRKFNDPRNKLLLNVGDVVSTFRPMVFIAENVPGVISGKHKYYWEGLRSTLIAAGYRTFDLRLEANQLGIPQIRKRIAMIGWRSGKDIEFILPSAEVKILRDALSNIDGLPNHEKNLLPLNCDQKKIAMRIKEGQKLSNVRGGPRSVHTWDIPEVFGRVSVSEKEMLNNLLKMRRQHRLRKKGDADPVPLDRITAIFGSKSHLILKSLIAKGYVVKKGKSFDLTHTFNGKYRRLSWDEPSLTVDTRFGDPRYFLHPDEDRGFSVREAARIQGFPDNFIFSGPEKTQYKVIGNAVPPPMAEVLAHIVKTLL